LHFFGPHLPYVVPDEYFDMNDPEAIELPPSVQETFTDKPPVQSNYSAHWTFHTMSEAESRKLIARSEEHTSELQSRFELVFRRPRFRSPPPLPSAPLFRSLHFFGPHLPYVGPDEYFDMYDPEAIELPPSVQETFTDKPPVQSNYSAHWTFDTMSEAESRKLIAVYWGYVTLIDEQIGRVLAVAEELGLMDSTAVMFSSDHGEFTGSHRLHDK